MYNKKNLLRCDEFNNKIAELEMAIADKAAKPGEKGEDGDKIKLRTKSMAYSVSNTLPIKYIGVDDSILHAPIRFVDITVINENGREEVITVPDYNGYAPKPIPEENFSLYRYDTNINRAVTLSGADITINGESQNKQSITEIPEKYSGVVEIRVYDEEVSSWFKGLVAIDRYAAKTVNKLSYTKSTEFSINAQLPPNIESLFGVFVQSTAEKYPGIEQWDTSNITNMDWAFSSMPAFNQDLSNWDMSNVTTTIGMFANSVKFNQPIGRWVTSNIVDMSGMFSNAYEFNQPIGEWDTSKVVNMTYMFTDARAFNQNISKWDVSSVVSHAEFDSRASKDWTEDKKPKFTQ